MQAIPMIWWLLQLLLNEAYQPTGGPTGWAAQYTGAYALPFFTALSTSRGFAYHAAYIPASNAARAYADQTQISTGNRLLLITHWTHLKNAYP